MSLQDGEIRLQTIKANLLKVGYVDKTTAWRLIKSLQQVIETAEGWRVERMYAGLGATAVDEALESAGEKVLRLIGDELNAASVPFELVNDFLDD